MTEKKYHQMSKCIRIAKYTFHKLTKQGNLVKTKKTSTAMQD